MGKFTPRDAAPGFALIIKIAVSLFVRLGCEGVLKHLGERFEIVNICMTGHFDSISKSTTKPVILPKDIGKN